MAQVSLYLFSLLELILNCIITMVEKFITNLDSSKASGTDGVLAVVPKNCEQPEL